MSTVNRKIMKLKETQLYTKIFSERLQTYVEAEIKPYTNTVKYGN